MKKEGKQDIVLRPTAGASTNIGKISSSSSLQFGASIFMAWNMPYGAMDFKRSPSLNHSSPFGQAVSPPSGAMVSVITPPANNAGSPNDAPSPLSKAITMKRSIERTRMFAEGRFDDLIKSITKEEGVVISSWMYQFWFFAFKTAKNWGFGPRYWNANLLDFSNLETLFPGASAAESDAAPRNMTISGFHAGEAAPHREYIQPSQLCSWSIHYDCEIKYDAIPENDSTDNFQDEAPWPAGWNEQSFDEKLISGLENNDFSTIETTRLPLAVPQIVKATEKAPDVLLREALGFAIMGRNRDLTITLLERIENSKINITGFYPLHLAATFLDGATSCCNIFGELLSTDYGLDSIQEIRDLYINDLGHTVLDSLMISILKSHTSTTPSAVDHRLRFQKNFAGEEVDICGRWDADSDCFRHLLLHCGGIVPKSWKHKFCHTSVQTICHCISLIRTSPFRLNTPSGIFLRHCSECGLKMQLQPLHTLVMTAFQLASCGSPDEDLFGIVACLLHILSNKEVDPLERADVSAECLFASGSVTGCWHQLLTAAELADRVPEADIEIWPAPARIGWRVFRSTLWLAQNAGSELEELLEDEREEYFCEINNKYHIFHKRPKLGVLHATIQTELLTYRRLQEGDPWTSKNFDLSLLLRDLQVIEDTDGQLYSIEMVTKELLHPFCPCGEITCCNHYLPSASDFCKHYFSNMDSWSRTKFIHFPYFNEGYMMMND
jgi:hypothetical protein